MGRTAKKVSTKEVLEILGIGEKKLSKCKRELGIIPEDGPGGKKLYTMDQVKQIKKMC